MPIRISLRLPSINAGHLLAFAPQPGQNGHRPVIRATRVAWCSAGRGADRLASAEIRRVMSSANAGGYSSTHPAPRIPSGDHSMYRISGDEQEPLIVETIKAVISAIHSGAPGKYVIDGIGDESPPNGDTARCWGIGIKWTDG